MKTGDRKKKMGELGIQVLLRQEQNIGREKEGEQNPSALCGCLKHWTASGRNSATADKIFVGLIVRLPARRNQRRIVGRGEGGIEVTPIGIAIHYPYALPLPPKLGKG